MKAIEELKKEHEKIKLMLKVLDKICQKLRKKEKVDFSDFERILKFIKNFADKCHHGKEEDLLFKELEKAGVPKEGGPIGVMLSEHDLGRNYVKEFEGRIKEKNSEKIIENAQNYIKLLTQHIEKEDNILYPMADKILSENKDKELIEGFEKIEIERIGEGGHKRLLGILKSLNAKYL